MAKRNKGKKVKSSNQTFIKLRAEWLRAHADVWEAYANDVCPTKAQDDAEYLAYQAALNARAVDSYEIEQKIDMALSSICKDFFEPYVRELLSSVIQDLHHQRR